MKETSQQYIKRILGYLDGQDPWKIQKSTAKKLEKAVKHLSRKQMRKRPAPGKWSIAEILAHLADTEVVASWRMRLILGHDGTPIQTNQIHDPSICGAVRRMKRQHAASPGIPQVWRE